MASGDKIFYLPKDKPQATTMFEVSTRTTDSGKNYIDNIAGIICVGKQNIVSGSGDNFALGGANKITGMSNDGVFCIGDGNKIEYAGCRQTMLIGQNNKVTAAGNQNSFVIGSGNTSKYQGTIIIGTDNTSKSYKGFCAGFNNVQQALSQNAVQGSIAIGYVNRTEYAYSTAIGRQNDIFGVSSVGIGKYNTIRLADSMFLGQYNVMQTSATGDSIYAFGFGNTVDDLALKVFAIGESNKTHNNNEMLIGRTNESYMANAYTIGTGNITYDADVSTDAQMNFTIGKDNKTIGQKAYVFGEGNTTTRASMNDRVGITIGNNNKNFGGIALGIDNNIAGAGCALGIGHWVGNSSTAVGGYSGGFGSSAVAIGSSAIANADRSIALGYNSETYQEKDRKTEGSIAIGSAKAYTSGIFIGKNYFGGWEYQSGLESERYDYEQSLLPVTEDGQTQFTLTIPGGLRGIIRSASVVQVRYNGEQIPFTQIPASSNPNPTLTVAPTTPLKKGTSIFVMLKAFPHCVRESLIPEEFKNRQFTVGYNGDDIFAINRNGDAYHTGNLYVSCTDHATVGLKVATENLLGDAYDNTATYAVDDIVIYNNTLYKCKEAIDTAEDFDADKWEATKITNLLGGGGDFVLTDETTGVKYRLFADNGVLGMKEVTA